MTRATKQPSQRERFIEASREHEADESPEAFERVFGKIVPPKSEGDIAEHAPKKPLPQKRVYTRRR